MKSLLDIYKENVGQRPLFSEIQDIDFYDNPTEALCRLQETKQWFICSLVYIDLKERERIFTVLELSKDEVSGFKSIFENRSLDQAEIHGKLKGQVKAIYASYSGNVFLFRSGSLYAIQYDVTDLPLKELQYFSDIEMVIDQSEEFQLKWKSFFLPSK